MYVPPPINVRQYSSSALSSQANAANAAIANNAATTHLNAHPGNHINNVNMGMIAASPASSVSYQMSTTPHANSSSPSLDFYANNHNPNAYHAHAASSTPFSHPMGQYMDPQQLGVAGAIGASAGTMPHATASANSSNHNMEVEPPLLEELGINLPHIWSKTLYVLMPNKQISQDIVADSDLAGPLFFCMALGLALLFTGKVHFAYIYGFGVFGCAAVWIILNLMHEQGIDMYRICSVLGYGLAPIVLLAFINVVFDLKGHVGFVLSLSSILWSSYSAARFFERILDLSEQRWLVAYPLFLLYTCFAIITVF